MYSDSSLYFHSKNENFGSSMIVPRSNDEACLLVTGGCNSDNGDGVLLPSNFEPSEYTVICGRGTGSSNCRGNQYLKSIVFKYVDQYAKARNKVDKSTVVTCILNRIQILAPQGGLFVKKDHTYVGQERYRLVEDYFAREKIGGILRDCLHKQYKSSTKAKIAKRKAIRANNNKRKVVTLKHSQASSCLKQEIDSTGDPTMTTTIVPESMKSLTMSSYSPSPMFRPTSHAICDVLPKSAHEDIMNHTLDGRDRQTPQVVVSTTLEEALQVVGTDDDEVQAKVLMSEELCSLIGDDDDQIFMETIGTFPTCYDPIHAFDDEVGER